MLRHKVQILILRNFSDFRRDSLLSMSFSFSELFFVEDARFTRTAKGLEVEYSIYDPCMVAVIKLQCKDSKGTLLYDAVLDAGILKHTIPKRFLSKTYIVNITVTHPENDVTIFQQSGVLGQKGK